MDTPTKTLLRGGQREELHQELVEHRQTVERAARRLREWMADLHAQAARPALVGPLDAAAAKLDEALKQIEKAINSTSNDASRAALVYLLRQFYAHKRLKVPTDPRAFERTLASVLAGAGLPDPNEVLDGGNLTEEEEDAVRVCAREQGITLADSPTIALAGVLASRGLPDIRTAHGKARIDLYPLPKGWDSIAVAVAARICRLSTKRIGDIEREAPFDLEANGDLFALVAEMKLK